ncbi:lysophospholipase [Paenibacillus crassostreae]|uniref:Lysophospholipase n=1 Tax=Paenibacillus crassostreae TaxID=1763538 RepID=A0A167G4Z6_9BACL|nr:lysophospholipase [Paenibacillus crassostreae]
MVVIHYTAIGDSLTVGFGAMPGNGFVPVYRGLAEYKLQTFVASDNLGINGLTSLGLYDYVSRNATYQHSLREADLITISIGGNDMIRAARSSNGSNLDFHFKQALADCKINFSRIIKTIYDLKKNSNGVYLIRVVGLYNPFPQIEEASKYIQQYNHFVETYSKETFAVANIYNFFRGREKELLFIDRIHPNGRGYRLIAEQLVRLGLRPLI